MFYPVVLVFFCYGLDFCDQAVAVVVSFGIQFGFNGGEHEHQNEGEMKQLHRLHIILTFQNDFMDKPTPKLNYYYFLQ